MHNFKWKLCHVQHKSKNYVPHGNAIQHACIIPHLYLHFKQHIFISSCLMALLISRMTIAGDNLLDVASTVRDGPVIRAVLCTAYNNNTPSWLRRSIASFIRWLLTNLHIHELTSRGSRGPVVIAVTSPIKFKSSDFSVTQHQTIKYLCDQSIQNLMRC